MAVKILFLIPLLTYSLNCSSQSMDTVDLHNLFNGREGGFSLYDITSQKTICYNPKHCKTRFSPCSTFKIPNSLIGLETGVIPDTSFVIPYDSLRHPKDSSMLNREPQKFWFQDLSLRRAFKYSCVWYYQELARRVGQDRMTSLVRKLNYGNGDISSGLDTYWLCGSMQISINEQIEFLKKLYLKEVSGFSQKNQETVKSIMLYETTPGYKLYGKTGSGDCWDDKVIGWYVGFLETQSGPKIFAMNILVNNFSELGNNFRIELTKKILKELKAID